MSFDKAKTIQAAQKFVQKGAYEKAIREYEKLAKVDPRDVSPRMKIAGLYAKLGQTSEAIKAYQDSAGIYTRKGFYNKAVAVFKQMLQVDPTYVDGYLQLADVLQKMGLLGDAMQQYKTVVAYYDKEGQTFKALETLQKMVDLDPSNLATQVKLAEIYYRQNMTDEGYKSLKRVIDDLTGQQRFDEALKLYERLLKFDPENVEGLHGCYKLLMQLQRHDHALPILQRYLRHAKDDLQAIRDVATVFGAIGNTKNQKIALKELAKRLHSEGNDAEAQEIYQKVLVIDPSDPTALAALGQQAQAASEEIIIPDSEPAATAPPPRSQVQVAPHRAEPASAGEDEQIIVGDDSAPVEAVLIEETGEPLIDEGIGPLPGEETESELSDEQVEELITESDVYVKYGLRPKAVAHLKRVALLRPDSTAAIEKLAALMCDEGDQAGAAETALRAADTNLNAGRADAAKTLYALVLDLDPGNTQARRSLNAVAATAVKESAPVTTAEVDDALGDTEIIQAASGRKPAPAAFDLDEEETQPIAPPSSLEDEISISVDVEEGPIAMEGGSASLEEELSVDIEEPPASDSLEDEISVDVASPAGSLEEDLAMPEPPSATSLESELDEEPLAPPAPEPARPPAPPPPPPVRRPVAAPPPPARTQPTAAPSNVVNMPSAAAPTAPRYEAPPVDPHLEELDEAEFYMSQGIFDEAKEIYDRVLAASPGHPVATQKLADIRAQSAAPSPVEEAPSFTADMQGETTLTSALGGDDEQVSFEDVFDAFKKGVEQNVAREDSATHYDLGLAYKEMGLLNDAIQEFVVALGGVGARKADCYNMIGLLHMEKGEPKEAAEAFQRGLGIENAGASERMGLKYELAAAFVQLDRKGEALTLLEEIEAEDANYRDVGERIIELKSQGVAATPVRSGAAEPSAAGGVKRRVSYV